VGRKQKRTSRRADPNAWGTAQRMSAFEGTAAALADGRDRSPIERQTSMRSWGSKHLIQRQVSDHSFQEMVDVRRA
jgi:hypothetical protein